MTRHETRPRSARAGVTLTELLVVLMIIGLLTTVAVPVYIGHAERARLNTAMLECREIAEAEMYCGALHGYYVPIQVLDDLPGRDTGEPWDFLQGEPLSSIQLVDINYTWAQLQSPPSQRDLGDYLTHARVGDLYNNWQGPFLNPQRIWSENTEYTDHPLDPWGAPYRLFSPGGSVGSNSHVDANPDYGATNFSDGQLKSSGAPYELPRYAIVSLGPDGEFDPSYDPSVTDHDDIIHFFGHIPNESGYTP